MESLKKLLSRKVPQKNNYPKAVLDDKTVFFLFKKAIQEEFGNIGMEKFFPDYFSNQTIFIRSTSSTWSAELLLNKGKILRKINREVGSSVIKEIKIK